MQDTLKALANIEAQQETEREKVGGGDVLITAEAAEASRTIAPRADATCPTAF